MDEVEIEVKETCQRISEHSDWCRGVSKRLMLIIRYLVKLGLWRVCDALF